MISSNFNSDPPDGTPAESRRGQGHQPRKHPLARGLAVGLFIALAITLVVAIARNRQSAPRLTISDYDVAVARWEKNRPAGYDLDLELEGKRPGKIHVEVRGGEVVHLVRDGVEPSQRLTWDYWSVDGQLETIGQELEMARHPAEAFGAPGASEVVMWASFDPRYGYPLEYSRVVLGADIEVRWKVTRFDVVEPKK